MLRTTRINPKISADTYLDGQHDFNKHTMSPLGTKAIAHQNPSQWQSLEKYGVMGWYIGPSFEHYRCYII